jgi:hypothetical protein
VSDQELLRRFSPVLRYDTHEQFFADHPGDFVGLPSVTLAGRPVTLADLDGPRGRCDTELHLQDADRDYRRQARSGHDDPALRDRIFGRVATDHDGRRWLQYWFWYLYNDAGLGGRFGLHEGDWECIQLRLGDGEPDRAVYAQHDYAETRPWAEVERDAGAAPIVYPARGTHASYFERGVHRTEFWWDIADGEGIAVRPTLIEIEDPPAGWLVWPGRWGDTRPRVPGLDSWSPRGPGCHAQWDDPAALPAKAREHEMLAAAPAPDVQIRRDGAGLRVDFDFRALADGAATPDRLVLTITGAGTPVVETLVVDTLARGTVYTRRPLDPQLAYTARASTIAGNGVPTAPGPEVRLEPVPARRIPAILHAVLGTLDRVWNGISARRR